MGLSESKKWKKIQPGVGRERLADIHKKLTLHHGSFKGELPEQQALLNMLPANAKVLEFGGDIGRASLIINYLLDDASKDSHVVVEPNARSAQKLAQNRDANGMKFRILNAAISNKPMVQESVVFGRTRAFNGQRAAKGTARIQTYTLKEVEDKYNIRFDTIVADCEGCMVEFLKENPTFLNQIKLIFIEHDFSSLEDLHYFKRLVAKHNFEKVFSFHKNAKGGPGNDWAGGVIGDKEFLTVWEKKTGGIRLLADSPPRRRGSYFTSNAAFHICKCLTTKAWIPGAVTLAIGVCVAVVCAMKFRQRAALLAIGSTAAVVLVIIVVLIYAVTRCARVSGRRSSKGPERSQFIKVASNKTEELVVAVCKEDLGWIDQKASLYARVTVYNKCGRALHFKAPNVKVIDMENVGTCDYAYLSYIIDRYDDLPDFVEFTKGSIPGSQTYRNCLPCYHDKVTDVNFLFNWRMWGAHNFGNHPEMSKRFPWVPSKHENMGAWIDSDPHIDRNMYMQSGCNTILGGHFGSTKRHILRTPKHVYEHLRSQQKHPREEVDHFIERTWGTLLCRPKYRLVVVAIFKNEAVAMREWLRHHLSQGVEHFYMIDNGSTDNWQSQIDDPSVVTVVTDTQRHKQVQHYNDYFLDTVKVDAKWVMVIDLDEFVYARHGQTLPDVLAKYPPDVSQVALRWKMFGSNGHVAQPKSIIHGFTRRAVLGDKERAGLSKKSKFHLPVQVDDKHRKKRGQADNDKTITRVASLRKFHQHYTKITYGKIVYVPTHRNEMSLKEADIHLNHYPIQSKEWFTNVKMTRGDVVSQKSDTVRNAQYFEVYDANDVEDTELADNAPQYCEKESPPIIIYYHIAELGDWKSIVTDQLHEIKASGLYHDCQEIRIGFLGDKKSILPFIKDKIKLVYHNTNLKQHEIPTINALLKFAKRTPENHYILYIHSKGVTNRMCNGIKGQHNWRKMMEYWVIEKYKLCVDYLDNKFLTCGVNMFESHYSGNFWWAQSNYIKNLKSIQSKNRISPEMWVLQKRIKGKHVSMFGPYLDSVGCKGLYGFAIDKDAYKRPDVRII